MNNSIEIEKALWEIGDGDLRRRSLVFPVAIEA
jgi:hypothetical protein